MNSTVTINVGQFTSTTTTTHTAADAVTALT